MRKVTCKACGKEFFTNAPRASYCCDQCRNYGRAVKRSKWQEEHKNYYETLKARRQNDEAEAES